MGDNNYLREIKPGVMVDVYDVLVAFGVTNPALAHALKKLLCPGQRGHKCRRQDLLEAIASQQRAIELDLGRSVIWVLNDDGTLTYLDSSQGAARDDQV